MLPYLRMAGANPSAQYASARQAKKALEDARGEVAELLGAESSRCVYFTSGGTEADNWALRSLLTPERRHIVTSAAEHHAVSHTCGALEDEGCEVTVTPVDEFARAAPAAVGAAIRDDTAVVSVMYANNETGAVNDVRRIAEHAHAHGVPFHCDAVAAAGHVNIDVARDGTDLLTLSAHKFYGPPGVGALYVRSGLRTRPLLYGGRQELGRRAGTQFVAGAVGMAAALRLACEEMDAETLRLAAVRDAFRTAIRQQMPHARFPSPEAQVLPGTLLVLVPGLDAGAALIALDRSGFEVSAGAACSAGAGKPSHVLLAAGYAAHDARCVLRMTAGRATTMQHAKQFAEALAGIAEGAGSL